MNQFGLKGSRVSPVPFTATTAVLGSGLHHGWRRIAGSATHRVWIWRRPGTWQESYPGLRTWRARWRNAVSTSGWVMVWGQPQMPPAVLSLMVSRSM